MGIGLGTATSKGRGGLPGKATCPAQRTRGRELQDRIPQTLGLGMSKCGGGGGRRLAAHTLGPATLLGRVLRCERCPNPLHGAQGCHDVRCPRSMVNPKSVPRIAQSHPCLVDVQRPNMLTVATVALKATIAATRTLRHHGQRARNTWCSKARAPLMPQGPPRTGVGKAAGARQPSIGQGCLVTIVAPKVLALRPPTCICPSGRRATPIQGEQGPTCKYWPTRQPSVTAQLQGRPTVRRLGQLRRL